MSIVTLGETDILNKCTTVNFTKDGRTMSITSHTSGGVKHKVRVTKNYHDCMKVNILMDALIATMKRQKIYKLKQLLSHWKRSLVRSSFTNHPVMTMSKYRQSYDMPVPGRFVYFIYPAQTAITPFRSCTIQQKCYVIFLHFNILLWCMHRPGSMVLCSRIQTTLIISGNCDG